MNIVYLIGNGFDIGLGLKTSYRDFIDPYREQLTDNENVAWMNGHMANHPQQWSDAEMAFGALNSFRTRHFFRKGRGRLNPCDYFRLESLSCFVRKDA